MKMEINVDKNDYSIDQIYSMYKNWGIEFQPDFQRKFVMDDKKASKLIESVLLGIPIPTIYLNREVVNVWGEEKIVLSVIDGQQRLTAFCNFKDGKLVLKWLEERPDLNWKTYKTLPSKEQSILDMETLRCIVIKEWSREDLKYEIFARLNQWATSLKPQELRNCIYRWNFNDLLKELADDKKHHVVELFWWAKKEESKRNLRMEYEENILRFFAFRNINDYDSSMWKTMNNYMAKNQNLSEDELKSLKKLFFDTLDAVYKSLWENAFMAYEKDKGMFRKFSWSVYDSIMVPFSEYRPIDIIQHADEIAERIRRIKLYDESYHASAYAASWSKDKVKYRSEVIRNVLKEIIWEKSTTETRCFPNRVKERLWEEKEHVCGICNQVILHKEDAEVDHVVPFSKWWETTYENAQLVHWRCNQQKGNRID